jgi:transcriptional regulator with XRE-family HTH domain
MPGHGLRQIREELGLTLKDVEAQSRQIAEACQNQEYLFTAGRLSQVENSFSLPSLYKLASLSQIYQIAYRELLRLYGVDTVDQIQTTQPGGSTPANSVQDKETNKDAGRTLTLSPLWG